MYIHWHIPKSKPANVTLRLLLKLHFLRLVCSGGDGTSSIVFTAYYKRYARDNKLDRNDPATDLLNAPLPIGILPTGTN